MTAIPDIIHEDKELQALRLAWIEAENAKSEAWKAFMDANKFSPLRRELAAAEAKEKAAFEAYGRALQNQTREDSPNGTDTRIQAAD